MSNWQTNIQYFSTGANMRNILHYTQRDMSPLRQMIIFLLVNQLRERAVETDIEQNEGRR